MEYDASSKFNFIKNRLSHIEEQIRILNKSGFFDEAKILELLAKDICTVFYKQDFIFLNESEEYPYVDLRSSDGTFFIQVSTEKDISRKIRETFNCLNRSSDKRVSSIKKVKFFFFSNSKKIGNKTYGNFIFEEDKDLITIDKLIKSCKGNSQLINELYNILKYQEDSLVNETKKLSMVMKTSESFLDSIELTLDGKYEIHRDKLVTEILNLKSPVIALIGTRGVGKKALIKKIYSDNVIIKPGVELRRCSNSEDIIGIEIPKLKKIIRDDKYTICITDIDKIEFTESIEILLKKLITDVINSSNKLKLIFTFSQDDSSWSQFFSTNNLVENFCIPPLSSKEISLIIKDIPSISIFASNMKFAEIMGIPLFLSILTKYCLTQGTYSDINQFFDCFWETIIKKNDTRRIQVLKFIACESCKNEVLDVNCDDFDSTILKELVSDGIILNKGDRYSFRYYFFEELVWNYIFYTSFRDHMVSAESFREFDKLGKRVEEYYVTYISERLFFDDEICCNVWQKLQNLDCFSEKWKDLTLKGIVKSDYSRDFLEKHIPRIVHLGLLNSFINAVNLYAFHSVVVSQQPVKIAARPCGSARPFFIYYLSRHKEHIVEKEFVKLCEDYSDYENYDQNIAAIVCAELIRNIYVFIMSDKLPSFPEGGYLIATSKLDRVCRIYEKESDEIKNFLVKIGELSGYDYSQNVKAITLINYILSFKLSRFAEDYPEEICNLADLIWRGKKQEDYEYGLIDEEWGLSHWSSYSGLSPVHPLFGEYRFFISIFNADFNRGLKWIISFINDAVDCYYSHHDEKKIVLSLLCDATDKVFYGDDNLWLGYTLQSTLPHCIKDMLFSLRKFLFYRISSNLSDYQYIQDFFAETKRYIINNSNNIAPLAVLVSIGIVFKDVIDPKETLEFASCPELIRYDLRRGISESNNKGYIPPVEYNMILEFQYGFRNYEYEYTDKNIISFFQYEKINGSDSVKEFCNNILTNLYSKVPNDVMNKDIQYSIHCMDIEVSDGNISSKEFTGPGMEYQQLLINQCTVFSNVINEIKQVVNGIENHVITKDKCIYIINKIISEPEDSNWHIYGDYYFIRIVTYVLSQFKLDLLERNWLCMEYAKFFLVYSHIMKGEDLKILYDQLENEISEDVINLILELILYVVLGSYEKVHAFIPTTVSFLKEHKDISRRVFNTVIILSLSIKTHIRGSIMLNSIDLMSIAKKDGVEILNNYLYRDNGIVIPNSLEKCDFAYLIRIFYSGVQINKENKSFFKKVWKRIINWANKTSTEYASIELSLDFVCNYFNQEIRDRNGETIIDIIFSDIEYQNLSQLSIRLFLRILDLSLLYYDSYNDVESRLYVWKFVGSLEEVYIKLPSGKFKNHLVKPLLLSPSYDPCWLNQLTSYSDDDIAFLIDQYEKFYKQFPVDVVYSLYGLNICKLLPRVIVYLEKAISVIMSTDIIPSNFWYVVFRMLQSIVFSPEKEKIKSRNEYYSSMMKIFERLSKVTFLEVSKLQEVFLENINQSSMNEINVGKTDENI